MSKALKSSGSSQPAALKSTSGGATKAEKIVRYARDPAKVRELEEGQEQRLAELERQVAPGATERDADVGRFKISSGGWIRGSYYPPIQIDAGVLEWFMKRARSRMTMVFDINDALKSYIEAKEKAERKKAERKKTG